MARKNILLLIALLVVGLSGIQAQSSKSALSGTYRYGTKYYVSFTGNSFFAFELSGDFTMSGTYSVSGSELTLNSTGGTAKPGTDSWTILDENTLRDEDDWIWKKVGGGTIAQGNSLTDKFDWLNAFAQSNGSYIIEVSANESISPRNFSYSGKKGITITLRGVGANRTLSPSSGGSMFRVGSDVTVILDNNITLRGVNNNRSLVGVERNGTLIMNNGATITGNNAGDLGDGGGVRVGREGLFIMNGGTISGNNAGHGGGVWVDRGGTFYIDGGTISGNTSPTGGGVYVNTDKGTFYMNGGTISGNTKGGGVYVYGEGTFTMSGGTITGNTTTNNGGGVCVESGTFAKTGGTITGYTGDQRNGNVVKDRSGAVRNYQGHAVYVGSGSSFKIKESTVGPEDNLSYNGTSNPRRVSGAWDN